MYLGGQRAAVVHLPAWPGPPWVEPAGNCEHYPLLRPTNMSHSCNVAFQTRGTDMMEALKSFEF